MTTSWKIFAGVLVVAVAAAMVMGSSHSSSRPAAATSGVAGAEFPKGPTGPLTAPPVDKVPPPSTDPAVYRSSMTASSTSSFGTTSSTTSTSSSASSTSSSSTASTPSTSSTSTPSGLSQRYSRVESSSEAQPTVSDSDMTQGQAPVETAAQRVARRLRGR